MSGPRYGCCVTHPPDVSHEEHMDRLDRRRNAKLLDEALDILDGERQSPSDYARAEALLREYARTETERLRHKSFLMESGRWPTGGKDEVKDG